MNYERISDNFFHICINFRCAAIRFARHHSRYSRYSQYSRLGSDQLVDIFFCISFNSHFTIGAKTQLNFTHETRKIYTYEKCMARAHLWIFQDNIKFPELTHPFSNFTAVQHSADPTMLCFRSSSFRIVLTNEWWRWVARWLEVKLWWGLTAQKQCFHYFNLIWLCIGQKNVRALVDFSNYKRTILNDSLRVPSATPTDSFTHSLNSRKAKHSRIKISFCCYSFTLLSASLLRTVSELKLKVIEIHLEKKEWILKWFFSSIVWLAQLVIASQSG